MANSTLIVDYVARGLDAAKPVGAPPIASGAMAAYYATDTGILYLWNNASWVAFSGGGSGLLVTATKTSNYSVLAADSGTVFDNTGAVGSVTFTLPAESDGLYYGFTVVAAQPVVVLAPGGVHIAFGPINSAAAGNLTCSTPFATLSVYAPKGATTQWVVRWSMGNWNVT
jgi:hypothetical protein